MTSPLFATAVARLAEQVDAALGRPEPLHVVDIGAGGGELLCGLAEALPDPVLARARFMAVERGLRPATLPEWIEWRREAPEGVVGLLLATEWLDNVPLDVTEVDRSGEPRLVLVDEHSGAERLDGPPAAEDLVWLKRWWPVGRPGTRAEIGHPRDAAWASAVATLRRGLALAVDYGHLAADRPAAGTLTGYRGGRQVTAVPDGSCDVTAHVAIDAVAAAGAPVAGQLPIMLSQRQALHALGVTGRRPQLALATADPAEYVRRLASATQATELTDPAGLGRHHWLLQPVAMTELLLPGDSEVRGTITREG